MTTSALGWEPLWEQDTPCSALEGLPADTQTQLIQMAADLLWAWSGKVFGLEEVTVRPCRFRQRQSVRASTFWGWAWASVLLPNGSERPVTCGSCLKSRCDCRDAPSSLILPGPIEQILEVQINGLPLSTAEYELIDRRRIMRYGGEGWPTEQHLDRPLGDDGTWGVTYLRGIPLPVGGRLALGKLACELALAYTDDTDCQLPERVQSISRQGVTMAILDAFEGLEDGRTGIWLIDSWIASVTMPAVGRASVVSPDYRSHQ